jgi:dipeptidyl aminopeptidase/acylaminoacyl peptidase
VELTPGEVMQRDGAIVAERLPGTVFYSGRKMSEASSGLFSVPLEGGAVRTIFRDPKPFQLADVSRDGKVAAIIRFPTQSDMQLLLVDVGSGKARQVFPAASRKVSLNDAAFSPDGKAILVTTDDGGEQGVILRLDAGSGEEIVRHVESGGSASLTSISVARKGETLAVGVNRGNESGIRILDAATLGIKASARLPLGQGAPSDISDDGSRVLATWSTPSVPVDLWSVSAATGEAKRLREEPRPSLASPPAMKVRVVEVKAHDGLTLPVNVYLPEGRKGKLPVIVSYHGGPAGSSQVRWSGLTAFFVSQGYAWVEPNVRGSGGFGRAFEEADNGKGRLEAFKDIEATGKWAASQRWADPDRVVVFGGSYGGYTVLVGLTRMPSLWRAGVDLFGVADLSTFMSTTSGLIREIFLLEFGDPDKDKAFLDSISPLRDADKIVDPLFVYAGANDPRVPRSESDLIVKALRARNVPVEYMVANDEGHSLARRENMIEFAARSARFLEKYAGPVPKGQTGKGDVVPAPAGK